MLPIGVFAGILCFIVIGLYLFFRTPADTRSETEKLIAQLKTVTDALNEAQKIGQFGSFVWDFEDPNNSHWTEELFNMFGLLARHKTPDIDTFIGYAQESDKAAVKQAWDEIKTKAGDFNFTFRAVAQDGKSRQVRVVGVTVFLGATQIRRIQGVVHDITREAEVDRAKSEFVSLASHQLKTPLTSIRWLTEALMSGTLGTMAPDQQKYITNIHQAVLQMIAMVNDLLNVSRIELNKIATQIEELDAEQMARNVISEQMHDADMKQISLSFACEKDLPHVFADRNSLRMVFQNLVSNAIKYTQKGGLVSVDLTTGGKHDSIFLTVTDNGIGIPKADQGRIFEKMHRASNAQIQVADGTGLGLYVIKTVIEKAGGSIRFTSTEGKGSIFYVTLPLIWKSNEPVGSGHPLK